MLFLYTDEKSVLKRDKSDNKPLIFLLSYIKYKMSSNDKRLIVPIKSQRHFLHQCSLCYLRECTF